MSMKGVSRVKTVPRLAMLSAAMSTSKGSVAGVSTNDGGNEGRPGGRDGEAINERR